MTTTTKNITLKIGAGHFNSFNLQITQPQKGARVHNIAFSKNSKTELKSTAAQLAQGKRASQASNENSNPIALYNFSLNDSKEKIARTVLRECAHDLSFQNFFDQNQGKSVYVGEKYIGEIKPKQFADNNFLNA